MVIPDTDESDEVMMSLSNKSSSSFEKTINWMFCVPQNIKKTVFV